MPAAPSRRAWGWHPLTDTWAARIVAAAGVGPHDLVIDLGAGEGALTSHLVQTGARVLAVELHPTRVRRLRERFQGQPVTHGPEKLADRTPGGSRGHSPAASTAVTVVHADVLDLRLPHRPFRVVASPPYNLSSAIMRLLLAPGSQLIAADLVVQRAFARRFADDWLATAGRAQRRWDVRCGAPIPRSAFRPAPLVDSMTLVVRRR